MTADASRIYGLSRELNLPPNVIAAAPDMYEQEAQRRRTGRALSNAPNTSSWLLTGQNAALAGDQAPQLAAIEAAARRTQTRADAEETVGGLADLRRRGMLGVLGNLVTAPFEAMGLQRPAAEQEAMGQERAGTGMEQFSALISDLAASQGPEAARTIAQALIGEFDDSTAADGSLPLGDLEAVLEEVLSASADPTETTGDLATRAESELLGLFAMLDQGPDPEQRAQIETEITRVMGELDEVVALRDFLPQLAGRLDVTLGDAPAPIYGPGQSMLVEGTRALLDMGIMGVEAVDTLQASVRAAVSIEPTEFDDYRIADLTTEVLRVGLERLLPPDQARQLDFATTLAQGGGSLLGFYGFAAARVPVWAAGAAVGGAAQLRDAEEHNATAGQRLLSFYLGAGLGSSEALPIDRALNRVAAGVGRDVMSDLLVSTTASTLEEFFQELVQSAGSDVISSYLAPYNPDGLQPMDWFDQAIVGGITGGVAGAALSGGSALSGLVPQRQPQQPPTQEFLDRFEQAVREAELGRRAPDAMEDALRAIVPDQQLYVAPEGLQELFQSGEASLPDLGITAEQFDDALTTGTAIPIDLAAYGARMIDTPLGNWVRANGSLSENELSVAEIQAIQAARQGDVDPALAAVEAELETFRLQLEDSQRIYDATYQQLRAAGQSRDVAARNAELTQAFWRTKAEEFGVPASELAARFGGLRIEGAQSPAPAGTTLQQAAEAVRRTPEFEAWFGDSAVRDASGKPRVLYHRTSNDFEAFQIDPWGPSGQGIFLGSDPNDLPQFHNRRAEGDNIIPAFVRIENPLYVDEFNLQEMQQRWAGGSPEFPFYIEPDTAERLVAAGFDGVVNEDVYGEGKPEEFVVFDPSQIKFIFNARPTSDPRILYQGPRLAPRERLEERGPLRQPRGSTYMGVGPQYTVENNSADAPVLQRNAPLIQASSNAGNADVQAEALDALFEKHPNPLASEQAWVDLANDAFSLDRVPMPPFRTIEIVQQGPQLVAEEIGKLSAGMVRDAEAGLQTAREFGEVYANGEATPDITAKAFLWSFLSRGVSPYVQEAAFLDAIVSDELTSIMQRAAADGWNDGLQADYDAWAASAIPPGSPGRGTQHNLNAFGRNFMRVMTQRHEDAGGRTGLEIIHDMIADGTHSYLIRREFLKRGASAGIDNKVVSFTLLLLLGRTDVLVLDRVQVRNQFNDGRFDGQNIYDTDLDENKKQVAGSGFAEMTFGHKGLLYYEAMEASLAPIIEEAYASMGLEGSLGRYHWDSWLLASNQEVGHASVEGLLRDAQGREVPYAGAFVRQGKYVQYDYGFRYGVLPDGSLSTLVERLDGGGATLIGYDAMADARSPLRKTLDKLKTAARKRGTEYGTTQPWTAGLTAEERTQYDTAIERAGSPAPDLWAYDPNAVGRAADAGQDMDAGGDARGGDTGAAPRGGPDVQQLAGGSSGVVPVGPEEFLTASRRALSQMGPVAAQVGTDPGEQAFLLDDGRSGYALSGDNIISVFSSPDSPEGVAARVLTDAIARGGRRLDGFDTFLPRLYAKNGFRAVARLPFSRDYAPTLESGAGADWNYDAMAKWNGGEPDVVFMVYDPESASAETDNVVVEYDAGIAAQDAALDALQTFDQSPVPEIGLQTPEQDVVMPIDAGLPNDQVRAQIEVLTQENVPIVDRITAQINERFGTTGGGNVKALSKVTQKASRPSIFAEKPWFTAAHVRDTYRFKTVISDIRQVPEMLQVVLDEGVQLVKIDTRKLFEPKSWGWRIIAFDLVMPNGQLVEWYLPLGPLEAQKKAEGHLIFEEWRNKTDEQMWQERAVYLAAQKRSFDGYDRAFRQALDQMGLSEAEARAAWSAAEASISERVTASSSSSGMMRNSTGSAPSGSSAEAGIQTPAADMRNVSPSSDVTLTRPSAVDSASIDMVGTPSGGDTDNVTDADARRNALRQDGDAPRGSITFGDDEVVIRLFKAADLSTFIHESGHYFLEMSRQLAELPDAPQRAKDDMDKIHEFLGSKPGTPFTRSQHEKWARGFEAYAMEGNAPSIALADAFSSFKAWLLRIYQSALRLNVSLTPEIRGVMDRMLATDQELVEVREAQQMTALFSEKPDGMSDAAWDRYQRLTRRSAQASEQTLLKKTMAAIQRGREAWYNEELRNEMTVVAEDVNAEPRYRLIEALGNQRRLEGGEAAPVDTLRLDKQELIDTFGPDILSQLSRSKIGGQRPLWQETGGVGIDEIAEVYGFKNGQAMIDTLRKTPKRLRRIRETAQERLTAKYGDPLNDGTLEEEALAALHNDQQAAQTIAELKFLTERQRGSTQGVTARVYKYRAQQMLQRMNVREASKPQSFLAAERRAAAKAMAALERGNAAEARQAKEQQLLNHYLYQEAVQIRDMVEKGREKMMRYRKRTIREKIEATHLDQIDQLLDRFDFRRRSEGQLQNAESLVDFHMRMIAEGREGEMAISEDILRQAERKHYSRLSVSELQGLFDTIQNLDTMGRRHQDLVDARGRRSLRESAQKLAERIRTNLGTGKTKQESGTRSFFNLLFSMDTMLIEIDGGGEVGVAYEELKSAIDTGMAEEQRMNVEMADGLEQLFSVYTRNDLDNLHKRKAVPGANGRPWAKAEILSVALNSGNADNLNRLLDPAAHEENRLTKQQMDALLATLDKRDWDFVQSVWDYVDSFWTQVAEVEERRTGVRPKKVEAKPVETRFGVYRGGYYPIKYDPGLSVNANLDAETGWDQFRSAGRFGKAHTANGHLQARKKGSNGRTLQLDLQPMFGHLRDVVRGITLSEAVDNTYRLLNHPTVRSAFMDAGRLNDLNTMNLWLADVGRGPVYNTDAVNTFFRTMKNNFTLSRLAFNFKTVALQVTGLGQSAATVGKIPMMRAFNEYRKRPLEVTQEIVAKSAFMAERQTSFQKDIYDFANETRISGPVLSQEAAGKGGAARVMNSDAMRAAARGRSSLAQAGFWPMIRVQFHVVDVPTWIAGYNEGMKKFEGDEGKAIQYADRMVARAQGSGLMADRSGFERGTLSKDVRQADFVRFFTTLQSYMIAKLNRGVVTTRRGVRDIREADGVAATAAAATNMAADLMLLYVFEAAFMALAYALMTDDEDDEDIRNFMLTELGSAAIGGVPFARDAYGAFLGYGGGGIYGSVLEVPSSIAVQVGQGEADRAFWRSITQGMGVLTGLPTTAGQRAIEGALSAAGRTQEETPISEAIFGYNPLAN
jgi:hypothetical protein